jgi:hypothetical protein
VKVKLTLFNFILGVLSFNVFSQGTPVTLPLSGELEFKPSVSFIYESQMVIDTLSVPKPASTDGTSGSYINYVLNLTSNKVGIGTTSPTEKFHVIGNGKFAGNGLFTGQLAVGTSSLISTSLPNLKLQIGNTWTFSDLSRAKIIGYNCRFWDKDLQIGRIIDNQASSAMMMNQDGSINLCTASASNAKPPPPVVWNYFTMLNNGNVGIGITNPTEQFQIGDIWTFHNGGTKFIGRNVTWNSSLGDVRIKSGVASMIRFNENGSILLGTAEDEAAGTSVSTIGKNMILTADGNVGIGTTDPGNFKLTVNGKINCTEVVVTSSVNRGEEGEEEWPDYVFAEDYSLRSLDEVASFIQENKRLPEIPSAAEVSENGVSLFEINTLLLKKVEELTLYILQQNEKMTGMQEQIDELKKR